MLTDFPQLFIEAERRRTALLEDAEQFRLAKLVRAARRRRATPNAQPPPESPPADRPEQNPAGRKQDAKRRYAVSR
jgi:hypothetical protein